MAGKKNEPNHNDLSIPWPFAPAIVRTNRDTSVLKLIAMIAMLCDHAGKMLFPQYHFLRVIGRIAFPIYAYGIVVGCVYTRDPLRYVRRLVLLALISQPIYAVAMGHTTQAMYAYSFAEHPFQAVWAFYTGSWNYPSILLSLITGVLLIQTLRQKQIVLFLGLLLLTLLGQNKLDYGIRGIVLMLLMYVTCSRVYLAIPIVTAYMIWWGLHGAGYSIFGVQFGQQMFAVCALPMIFIPMHSHWHMPKWMGYVYYPLHLAVIWVVNTFLMG